MRNRWLGIAEECCAALVRASYSTNIKDRRDCSVALATPDGVIVAQAEVGTPLHLGIMPGVLGAILAEFPPDAMQPGDMYASNLPYPEGPGPSARLVAGGAHLPRWRAGGTVGVDRPPRGHGRLCAGKHAVRGHRDLPGGAADPADRAGPGRRVAGADPAADRAERPHPHRGAWRPDGPVRHRPHRGAAGRGAARRRRRPARARRHPRDPRSRRGVHARRYPRPARRGLPVRGLSGRRRLHRRPGADRGRDPRGRRRADRRLRRHQRAGGRPPERAPERRARRRLLHLQGRDRPRPAHLGRRLPPHPRHRPGRDRHERHLPGGHRQRQHPHRSARGRRAAGRAGPVRPGTGLRRLLGRDEPAQHRRRRRPPRRPRLLLQLRGDLRRRAGRHARSGRRGTACTPT